MQTKMYAASIVRRYTMDFKLDKAHLLQQELFRSFAEKEIKPLAKDMDENEEYDQELLQKMQKYLLSLQLHH